MLRRITLFRSKAEALIDPVPSGRGRCPPDWPFAVRESCRSVDYDIFPTTRRHAFGLEAAAVQPGFCTNLSKIKYAAMEFSPLLKYHTLRGGTHGKGGQLHDAEKTESV